MFTLIWYANSYAAISWNTPIRQHHYQMNSNFISPESYEQWHPHNWPITTTNQLPPHLASYLPAGTSKGVCVCLNIIAPSIPLTDKTMCISLQFEQKSNPIIEYTRKCNINWNVKRFSMFDISQVILARTNSNLCRKELTVHWSTPNSLIRSYLQPCTNSMWGDISEAVAPIAWYTRLWMPERMKFSFQIFS